MKEEHKSAVMTAAGLVGAAALCVAVQRHKMPHPRTMGEKNYSVVTKELRIPSGEHTIYGELIRPKKLKGPLPTVICCHGFGSNYEFCEGSMGISLAKSGYQTYCFDFFGGNKHSKSGGKMTDMSIFTEQNDLRAVLDFFLTMPEVDQENLFLLGESQGGCVSAMTAPEYEDKLKALILYYPALCIPDDAKLKFPTQEQIPAVSRTFGKKIGRIYHEHLLDYKIYDAITGFGNPTLILHGDNDKIVHVSYAMRAAEVYPDVELKIYPKESHGFTGRGKLRAAKDTYEFLKKHTEK